MGQADFSTGAANYISIALDANGIPYVTYSDAGNGSMAIVKKFEGGSWVDVGTPGISTGSTYLNCLAIAGNGTLYAAYRDTEVRIKMFDGTTWVDVGSSPTANAGKLAFAIDGNNVPYVAYVPTSQLEIAVKKFYGSNWSAVGTPAMAGRPGNPLVLVFGAGNNPIISYWNGGAFVKSFSPLAILPLRLTEFNGSINKSEAWLNWKTDNEINTHEFNIERSTDGRNYTTAGTVAAANQSGMHQYGFSDHNVDHLGASPVYYRLKQIDVDGKSTYSQVLILPLEQSGSRVVCYPNPVTSGTNITITLGKAEKVHARIFNNLGQVVQDQQWNLPAGSSSLPINMSRLLNGLYYLEISSQSIKKQIGLVKQ